MKVNIDDNVCKSYNTTKDKIVVLAAIQYGTPEIYEELLKEGYITKINASLFDLDKKYSITNKGINLVSDVILASDNTIEEKKDEVEELAKTLRDIYPKGKMLGTSYYYRGNLPDIVKKLKSFFKRYGTEYTNEQIIEATSNYIKSFNGNYTYLKLLKYFIWKDEHRDGEIIQSSLLADWIENKGQDNNNLYWTSHLN